MTRDGSTKTLPRNSKILWQQPRSRPESYAEPGEGGKEIESIAASRSSSNLNQGISSLENRDYNSFQRRPFIIPDSSDDNRAVIAIELSGGGESAAKMSIVVQEDQGPEVKAKIEAIGRVLNREADPEATKVTGDSQPLPDRGQDLVDDHNLVEGMSSNN